MQKLDKIQILQGHERGCELIKININSVIFGKLSLENFTF